MKFKNYLIIGILIITLSTTILLSGYTSTMNKDIASPLTGFDNANIITVLLPVVLLTLGILSIYFVRHRTTLDEK